MNKTDEMVVYDPVVVSQSTTEPVLHGGYQDPFIRCDENGKIYVRFNSRRDCPETFGDEIKNPIYCSCDEGKTWQMSSYREWVMASEPLPNGDRLVLREHELVTEFKALPKLPKNRAETHPEPSGSIQFGITYTCEELQPIIGSNAKKSFKADRIKAGSDEIITEECIVHWENMPIHYMPEFKGIYRIHPTCKYKVDSKGVLWMPVFGGSVNKDGSMNSMRLCTHLLRSDDFGHNWHYVSTVIYKEKYHHPNSTYGVEGFDEATVEILDDGSIIMIMRSGSLHPFVQGKAGTPIPQCYIAKSTDEGKTWDYVKPFYDYGIRPQSVKLNNGTIILISGRPGVYVRACNDTNGEEWSEPIHLVKVPENEIYNAYYEYSCSNCDICAYDENTAFVVYSNFKLNTPEGIRAKSILVSKIKVEKINSKSKEY